MDLFDVFSEFIVEPAIKGCVSRQAGESFAGVRTEVKSRLAARVGTPGNHDIERAIRVAQLQAMMVTVANYRRLLDAWEQSGTLIDQGHDPNEFHKAAQAYLNKKLGLKVTVSIDAKFVDYVSKNVAADLKEGAQPQNKSSTYEKKALDYVEAEFLAATDRLELPPRFKELMFSGDGTMDNWMSIYRAFLCEGLKTNQRFSDILKICLLEGLKEQGEETQNRQNEIGKVLKQVAEQQRRDAGEVGAALSRLEAKVSELGPGARASHLEVAEKVFAELHGLSDQLTEALDILRGRNAKWDVARKVMFRRTEAEASDRHDFEPFRYIYQVDPFEGRAESLRTIERDLLDNDRDGEGTPMFGWMALCGEGGMGKSRLAQELVARNRHIWVHSGFASVELLSKPDAVFDIAQGLTAPTLIVVDYTVATAANLPEFMRAWANFAQSDAAKFPVRIVIIARRARDAAIEALRGVGIDPNADMGDVRSAEQTSCSPLVLGPLGDQETLDLMRERMRITAQGATPPAPLRDVTDKQLLDALNRFDRKRRPLFAAMVAAALQRDELPDAELGEEDNREKLFGGYIKHQSEKHWLPRAKDLEGVENALTTMRQHGNLIRLSTSAGRLTIDKFQGDLKQGNPSAGGYFPILSNAEKQGMVREDLLKTMTGEGLYHPIAKDEDFPPNGDEFQPEILPTLEPDMLGERFLLMTRDEFGDARPWAEARTIAQISWRLAPDETAAFLRMAAQDYPQRMQNSGWLPPATADHSTEILRARARMLRNVCADIAVSCGRDMPSPEELNRLFDLVDAFHDDLVALAHKDEETRDHYGQVLRQVANIGGRLGNAALAYIDPISAKETEADQVKSSLSSAFFSGADSGLVLDDTLDGHQTVQPLPQSLADIIVSRLGPLADRAGAFLTRSGDGYTQRRPFESAWSDVLGTVYFAHRDNAEYGGRWPTQRDDAAAAVVTKWKSKLSALADGSFDDVAVMAGMLSTISYTDYQSSIDDYTEVFLAAERALAEPTKVPALPATRFASMLGNALVVGKQHGELEDREKAHIRRVAGLLGAVITKVDCSDVLTQQQASRIAQNFCKPMHGLMFYGEEAEVPGIENLLRQISDLLQSIPRNPEVSTGFLSMLSIAPAEFDQSGLHAYLRGRIEAQAFDAEDFNSPKAENAVYSICQLAFGQPDPQKRLPQDLALDLLRALDETVGGTAKRNALRAVEQTLYSGFPQFDHVPLDLARTYVNEARRAHGFDANDLISSATLTIWGHQMLRGAVAETQAEVNQLWKATKEPAASLGRIVSIWGAAMLLDATRISDTFSEEWSVWLHGANRLSEAQDLERLGSVGLGDKEAQQYIRDYNNALADACKAAARLDIAAGGDPAKWMERDNSMKAYAALHVERSVANALADRITKAKSVEATRDDLETVRGINARIASDALPRALAHIVSLMAEDDPERDTLIQEAQFAMEKAKAASANKEQQSSPTQFVVSPKEYKDVQPLETPLALEETPEWHLPPVFSGDWSKLALAEATQVCARVRAAFPTSWGDGVVEAVRAVRAIPSACYPGFQTVEILFKFENRPAISQSVLLGEDRAFWLTGNSPGLHEFNALRRDGGDVPYLDISTEEKAADYLRFFCSAVHGPEGPFRIVEDAETLADHMTEGEPPEDVLSKVGPIRIKRLEDENEDGAWLAHAMVVYEKAIFSANFKILRAGMIEMTDDEPLASDLAIIRQVMMRGLRQVRGT